MARRHLLKAYNDFMVGAGQSSAGYNSLPEMSGQGKSQHMKGKIISMKPPGGETSCEPQNPKQLPPIPNAPVTKWFKKNNGEINGGFLDIDGDSFPQMEKKDQSAKEQPNTCHKVRSYLSLMDLTRPYGRRESPIRPVAQRVGKPSKTAAFTNPQHQHTQDKKGSGNVPTSNWDDTIKMGGSRANRNMSLPRGFGTSDMTYVPPKFMPTYREMASEKNHRENVVGPVSIMEPTPPSMQKWAVEWNKEPKSFSIEELKEDLRREGFRNGKKRPEPPPAQDSAPPQEIQSHKPNTETKSTPGPSKKSSPTSTKKSPEPQTTAQEVSKNQSNLQIPNRRHNFLDDTSDILDSAEYYERQLVQPPADWVTERFSRKQPDYALSKEKYSFRETIQKNEKQNQIEDSEECDQCPLVMEGEQLVSDIDKNKFHEWFKGRFSTTTVSVLTLGSHSVGSGAPGKEVESVMDQADPEVQKKDSPKGEYDYGTSPSGSDERQTSYRQTEVDSSFFNWLKERGHQFERGSRDVETRKPEEGATVKTPTAKFPWSRSYLSRYVPGKRFCREVKSKDGPRPSKESLKTEEAWSKRLDRSSSTNKVVKAKSRKDGTTSMNTKDRKRIECTNQVPSFPVCDIDNEADHVNQMRQEEIGRGKPISMKKLFPVRDQTSKWSWESGFEPRPVRSQEQFRAPEARGYCSSPVERKPSRSSNIKEANSQDSWAFSNSSITSGEIFQDIAEDTLYNSKLEHGPSSTVGPDSADVGSKGGKSLRDELEGSLPEKVQHDNMITTECQSPNIETQLEEDIPPNSFGTITLTRKPEPTLIFKNFTEGSDMQRKTSQEQIGKVGNVFAPLSNGVFPLFTTVDEATVREFDNQSDDADQEWSEFVGHKRDVSHTDSDLMQMFGRTSPPISQIISQVNVLPGC